MLKICQKSYLKCRQWCFMSSLLNEPSTLYRPSQDFKQISFKIPSTTAIFSPAVSTPFNDGRSSFLTASLYPEQNSKSVRYFMSSSMMKVTLKVKLTKFRLNFISAKAASMKELCYSSSSPETEFTVIFNGDISGLIFAAIRKAIICCSLDCKCTKRLFCKQFPLMLSKLSTGLNPTSKQNWNIFAQGLFSMYCRTCSKDIFECAAMSQQWTIVT